MTPPRHPTHTFTRDWCDGKYCSGCNTFIDSNDPSIADPCPMDRRAEVVVPDVDWFAINRGDS